MKKNIHRTLIDRRTSATRFKFEVSAQQKNSAAFVCFLPIPMAVVAVGVKDNGSIFRSSQ